MGHTTNPHSHKCAFNSLISRSINHKTKLHYRIQEVFSYHIRINKNSASFFRNAGNIVYKGQIPVTTVRGKQMSILVAA